MSGKATWPLANGRSVLGANKLDAITLSAPNGTTTLVAMHHGVEILETLASTLATTICPLPPPPSFEIHFEAVFGVKGAQVAPLRLPPMPLLVSLHHSGLVPRTMERGANHTRTFAGDTGYQCEDDGLVPLADESPIRSRGCPRGRGDKAADSPCDSSHSPFASSR